MEWKLAWQEFPPIRFPFDSSTWHVTLMMMNASKDNVYGLVPFRKLVKIEELGGHVRVSEHQIIYGDVNALNIDIGTEKAYNDILLFMNEEELLRDVHYIAILHGLESFRLEGLDGKGKMQTGNLVHYPNDSGKDCPHTFYKFSIGEKIVAKALVDYLSPECDKIVPTIEAIEVLERYNNRHIGSKLIELIEAKASAAGFDRVIAHDIGEERKFWNNHGYSDMGRGDGIKILFEKNGEGE